MNTFRSSELALAPIIGLLFEHCGPLGVALKSNWLLPWYPFEVEAIRALFVIDLLVGSDLVQAIVAKTATRAIHV